jgi:hypothetical protein
MCSGKLARKSLLTRDLLRLPAGAAQPRVLLVFDVGEPLALIKRMGEVPIGAAVKEARSVADSDQPVDDRTRHRPGGDIAADDDSGYILALDVGQGCLECRQNPVNVVDGSDAQQMPRIYSP